MQQEDLSELEAFAFQSFCFRAICMYYRYTFSSLKYFAILVFLISVDRRGQLLVFVQTREVEQAKVMD